MFCRERQDTSRKKQAFPRKTSTWQTFCQFLFQRYTAEESCGILNLIDSQMGRIFCAAPEWIYTRMERSSGCARPPRLNSVFPNDAEQAGPGLRRAFQTSHQRRRKADLPRRGRATGAGFFVWSFYRPHRTGRDILRLLITKQCYDVTIRKEVTKILWLKN